MRPELARWKGEFEQKYNCKMTISVEPKKLDVDTSHSVSCPICEQSIMKGEAAEIVEIDDMQMLAHSACTQTKE